MKERPRDLEAWLDGTLEGEELLAFRRRLEAEPFLAASLRSQGAIDDALRRRFTPPDVLRALPDASGLPAGPRHTARRWRLVPLSMAALAAALLAWITLRPAPELAPTPEPAPELAEQSGGGLLPVGPLVEGEDATGALVTPDLALLHAEVARAAGDAMGRTTCVAGDQRPLESALATRYGETLRLLPEAVNMLNGPYSSAEWPTGTILTGFPENEAAVLVVERGAMLRCCLHIEPPRGQQLRIFTWQVGPVFLTEITPLSEPHLIQYFELAP